MVHVWAFDPGETTGWCHLSVNEEGIGVFDYGEDDHFAIGNLLFDNSSLKAAVSKQKLIELDFVIEKYVMNSKITQSPWSLETTGLVRYFSALFHVPLHFQTPSQAKGLIKDNIIKKAGIYVPGKGHAMDAVRHALYFLTVKKGLLKECLKP